MGKISRCPICNSVHFSLLISTMDFSSVKNEKFSYAQCSDCGVYFLFNRPTEDEIGNYYDRDYQPYVSWYNFLTEKFISYRTKKEVRLFGKLNKGAKKLLDVGCSWGKYIKDMHDYGGFSVIGVEFNKKMCSVGQNKLGLDIRHGNLIEQKFDDNSFDIIVLSHVIEHLYNPKEVIKEIYRILSLNGLVFIKTPNINTFERRIFAKYWFPFEAPRHTVLFNKKNLCLLLSRNSFVIRKVIYEKTPNNIILSIKNYFIDKKYPKLIVNFFNLNNYLLLVLLTPISFLLGLLKTSGRIVVLAQKNNTK